MADISLCYVVVIITVIALIVWGLMDIIREKTANETSEIETVSRQIRGFGILVLSQIVLLVGGALCIGAAGGTDALMKQVSRLF